MPFTLINLPKILKSPAEQIKDARHMVAVEAGNFVIAEHMKLISHWTAKPTITANVSDGPKASTIRVSVSDNEIGRIWKLHNNGTGIYGPKKTPITIKPKNRKVLKMQSDGKFMGFSSQVTVRGIKPKHYTKIVNRAARNQIAGNYRIRMKKVLGGR